MSTSRFPTFRLFGRFVLRCTSRLQRVFLSRRSAVVYFILFSIGWLALSIDRWLGRRAWATERDRLAAAGESLNPDDFLPPRPPDRDNFFALPELLDPAAAPPGPPVNITREYTARVHMWFRNQFIEVPGRYGGMKHAAASFPPMAATTPLKEWCDVFRKTKVLPHEPLDSDPAKELIVSAEQWQPFLQVLFAAAEGRRYAVFLPPPRERGGNSALNLQTFGVGPLSRSLALYSFACHSAGDFHTPLSILRVLRKLEEGCAGESNLHGVITTGFVLNLQKEVILSGIRRHAWTEDQLAEFGTLYDLKPPMERIRKAIAVERAAVCRQLEKCEGSGVQFIVSDQSKVTLSMQAEALHMRWFPEGPFLRRCALVSRTRSEALTALSGPVPAEGWAAKVLSLDGNTPSDPFGQWFGGTIGHSVIRGLMATQFIAAGCALERYFLTHRRYPASLREITPALPSELLMDSDGQPLRYRASADGGTFCLWSVGRNRMDDQAVKSSDDLVFTAE